MKEIKKQTEIEPLYISVKDLMKMLSIGRTTAEKVGIESNAKVKFGKCTRYNLKKIMSYIESNES